MASATFAPFKAGRKELYLPNFIITLLRSEHLPAHYARFHVPLWFSKLDLRDYLYHAYGVRVYSITSYVKQSRAQFSAPENNNAPMLRRWHRPRAQKYMTVHLEQPFVWPKEPEEYGQWDQQMNEDQEESMKREQEKMAPTADTLINEDRRETMKEQAKALLEGKQKWKPMTSNKSVGGMLSKR